MDAKLIPIHLFRLWVHKPVSTLHLGNIQLSLLYSVEVFIISVEDRYILVSTPASNAATGAFDPHGERGGAGGAGSGFDNGCAGGHRRVGVLGDADLRRLSHCPRGTVGGVRRSRRHRVHGHHVTQPQQREVQPDGASAGEKCCDEVTAGRRSSLLLPTDYELTLTLFIA